MTSKLDFAAIEIYAAQYAKVLCDNFFAQHQQITGPQILGISNVQQVNLFVVSSLFEKWKAETTALRSPFFDFENETVQKALHTFMNTLSQHISVKRDIFEGILANATSETLVLVLNPHHYFDQILREQPNFVLKAESLKTIDKYTKLNQIIPHGLVERMDEQDEVYVTQAVTWLNEICINDDLFDNPDEIVAQFSETVVAEKAQFFKKTVVTNPEEVSFFDMAVGISTPEVPKIQVNVAPTVAKTIEPVTPEANPLPQANAWLVSEPEKNNQAEQTPVAEIVPVAVPEQPTPAPEIANTLNDSFAGHQPSLNDLLKSTTNQTVAQQNSIGRIDSIAGVISLNQKYVFINSLFHGDTPAYQQAIEELDSCGSLEAAKELMNKKYAPKYLWRMSADDADTLFEMVKRKFS